jgi:hypothetical protein
VKTGNIFHTLTSIATALGRNAIPPGLYLFGGGSAVTAMILYFLETLLGVILATAYVLLRAPAEDPGYQAIDSASFATATESHGQVTWNRRTSSRKTLLLAFLVLAFGFGVLPGIFPAFVWAIVQPPPIPISAVVSGLAGIASFQIIKFVADFFVVGKLTPQGADSFLQQSRGRIATMFLSIFVGLIIAMVFKVEWFVIPFAALKTTHDVGVCLFDKPVHTLASQ